jgi:hypothetical protein
MNVEIGTEAAQFPEKKYINEIFLAVWFSNLLEEFTVSVLQRTERKLIRQVLQYWKIL